MLLMRHILRPFGSATASLPWAAGAFRTSKTAQGTAMERATSRGVRAGEGSGAGGAPDPFFSSELVELRVRLLPWERRELVNLAFGTERTGEPGEETALALIVRDYLRRERIAAGKRARRAQEQKDAIEAAMVLLGGRKPKGRRA